MPTPPFHLFGNVCGKFNFAVCGFLVNPQTFLPQKFLTCSTCQPSQTMSLLRYFSRKSNSPSSSSVPLLTPEVLHEAKKRVASVTTGTDETGPAPKQPKKTYSSYFAEDRARIGQYAADHRTAKKGFCSVNCKH